MDRMIYFLHIHKSGGSTFVNLAQKNGEKLHYPNKNGNPYDENDRIISFWQHDKENLLNFFNSQDFTFCANETCLRYFFLDPKIKYVTVLRHPVDIILSCYHHQKKGTQSNKSFNQFIDEEVLLERNKLALQKNENLYFNGPLIYYLTGSKDAELARERLKNFDAIIFIDNYAEDIKVMEQIAGWNILDVETYRVGTSRNSNAKKELSSGLYDEICRKLKKDIDFYEEVKSKVKQGRFIQ
jgi:hypothetical protein